MEKPPQTSTETSTKNAIETRGLGKRYKSFWALQDCTVQVPAGSITALVGSNGAGKSTLLQLLTGLNQATTGSVNVFGQAPAQTPEFLSEIGFLAQETPLYKQLTAEDHVKIGAALNTNWDETLMRDHLRRLEIPFDKPVGKLSGGQKAQVALAMALAKKPQLLLLDEPVAALDPLARRDFLSSLAQAVAESKLTVIMSSHLLEDLERICDDVIIMARGRVQLNDSIEHASATHRRLVGARQEQASTMKNSAYEIIHEEHTTRQSTLLVRMLDPQKIDAKIWQVSEPTTEDIVLAYMQRGAQTSGAQQTSTQNNTKQTTGGAR